MLGRLVERDVDEPGGCRPRPLAALTAAEAASISAAVSGASGCGAAARVACGCVRCVDKEGHAL